MIPSLALPWLLGFWPIFRGIALQARIVIGGGILDLKPAPKTSIGGMRVTLFWSRPPVLEVRLWVVQPGASLRPAMTKRSCTPPSAVPFEFLMKRASRTGPFNVTKITARCSSLRPSCSRPLAD